MWPSETSTDTADTSSGPTRNATQSLHEDSETSTSLGGPVRPASTSNLHLSVMASSIVDWDAWEAPKPWSPKPLTPVGHHINGLGSKFITADDQGYYGFPQFDCTPPKLPACAHSTPNVAPSVAAPGTSATAPGTVPSPGGERGNCSPSSSSLLQTPQNVSAASSGYGSNSSWSFGFSPLALTYLDGFGDASCDAISALGTPSGGAGVVGEGVEGVVGERTEEMQDCTPLSLTDPDIIYTGMTTVRADTQRRPEVLVISPQRPHAPRSPSEVVFSLPEVVTSPPEEVKSPPAATPTPPPSPATSHSDTSKPKEPYFSLIAKAILRSENKRLILSDIYDLVLDKYPYFRTAETSWRNVIRHNLSVNDCFVKVGRAASGRGCYWGIHPSCIELFRRSDFRRREAKRLVQVWEDSRKGKENRTAPPDVAHTHVGSHVMQQTTPIAGQNGFRQAYGSVNDNRMAPSGCQYNYPGQYVYGQTAGGQAYQQYVRGYPVTYGASTTPRNHHK